MTNPFYGVIAPLVRDILEAASRCRLSFSADDGSDDDMDCLSQEIAVSLDCLSTELDRARMLGDAYIVSAEEWHVVADASALLIEILAEDDNMDRISRALDGEFGRDGDELLGLATQILFLDCVKSAGVLVSFAVEVDSCRAEAMRCEEAVSRLDRTLSVDPPAFSKAEIRADITLLQETLRRWKDVRELAVQAFLHEPFNVEVLEAYRDEFDFFEDDTLDFDEEIPVSYAAAALVEMEGSDADDGEYEDGCEALEALASHLEFFSSIFFSSHHCPR